MTKRKGFTLLELIVAMVIIAIMAVGALEFYVYSLNRFIMKARLDLQATDFARETMEKMYCLTPEQLVSYSDTPDLPDFSASSDPTWKNAFSDEFKDRYGASRAYTVTSKPNYKIITTTVTWTR
ncbi:MAG: type II secretion system protein [Candidatus Omnitrophota bacterium]|nr:type II secretion system protein [Candidatus Omnitrophota bacterium]